MTTCIPLGWNTVASLLEVSEGKFNAIYQILFNQFMNSHFVIYASLICDLCRDHKSYRNQKNHKRKSWLSLTLNLICEFSIRRWILKVFPLVTIKSEMTKLCYCTLKNKYPLYGISYNRSCLNKFSHHLHILKSLV